MMICGSCGMRMDGRAVLACKERMKPIVEGGHVPVISAMGNLPIVKDLVVDMDPFWAKIRAMKPWLDPGYDEIPERSGSSPAGADEPDPQGVALHHVRLLRLRVQLDGVRPRVSSGRRRSPRASASSATRATRPRSSGWTSYNDEHGIWDCTRCYFCNERCPKGVDPRDAIAKLGAESIKQGIDHDMGAKHAKWFVTSAKTTGWLRETELVPKTQGVVEARSRRRSSRSGARQARQGAAADPAARGGGRPGGARALRARQGAGRATAPPGSSRASARSRGSSTGRRRRRQRARVTPGERRRRRG